MLLLSVIGGESLTVHEAAQQTTPPQVRRLEHAAALDLRLACRGKRLHAETVQRPPPPPQVRYMCMRTELPGQRPLPWLPRLIAQTPSMSRGTHSELFEQARVRTKREPDYSTGPGRRMAQGRAAQPRMEDQSRTSPSWGSGWIQRPRDPRVTDRQ